MLLSKRTITWMVGLLVLLAAGLAWWDYRREKNTAAYELLIHGNPSEAELMGFLDSDYEILVSNTLSTLEHRKLAGGREKAANLLTSRDPHIWYVAALYLGAIGDQRSVPYLIRGLTHPAWRSRPRVVNYLQNLTGQNYGEKKEEWIKWWSAQKNDKFDFTCVTTQEWRGQH
jgi:hypothetical protein